MNQVIWWKTSTQYRTYISNSVSFTMYV